MKASSAAAAVVNGRPANGTIEWKLQTGFAQGTGQPTGKSRSPVRSAVAVKSSKQWG